MTQNLPAKSNGAITERAKPVPLSDMIRNKIGNVLTGKKADDFITAVISLTNQDPALKECDNTSLVAAALQAQSLNLALHKSLGQAFVVPYKDNKRGRTMATFQLGYKGYIQLAIRSGYYRKINVLAVKEGELKHYDPLTEDIAVELIDDAAARENATTLGYYCMFEYLNGFRKTMYWSKGKMESHALRYSQAYKSDKNKGWSNSFWTKDFDAMALKTMLRQILSKWGVMSVELQNAYENDYRVMAEDIEFSDAMDNTPEPTTDDLNKALEDDGAIEGEFTTSDSAAEEPWDGQSAPTMPASKPKAEKKPTIDSLSDECFDLCSKKNLNMDNVLEMEYPGTKKDDLTLEQWQSFRNYLAEHGKAKA